MDYRKKNAAFTFSKGTGLVLPLASISRTWSDGRATTLCGPEYGGSRDFLTGPTFRNTWEQSKRFLCTKTFRLCRYSTGMGFNNTYVFTKFFWKHLSVQSKVLREDELARNAQGSAVNEFRRWYRYWGNQFLSENSTSYY